MGQFQFLGQEELYAVPVPGSGTGQSEVGHESAGPESVSREPLRLPHLAKLIELSAQLISHFENLIFRVYLRKVQDGLRFSQGPKSNKIIL